MFTGFWKLTWVELKIFLREPLGVIGTIGVPLILFLLLGRIFGRQAGRSSGLDSFLSTGLPIFASILISFSAVLSLIAIVSIYREGGILKRLRATPLRPQTILTAHVFLKLASTAVTLFLLVLVGKRFYPVTLEVDLISFTAALLLSTLSILSVGFVIASLVPTARFAQPIGSAVLYPMLAISGLFVPLEVLPPVWRIIANLLPVTHAVSLLQGLWSGGRWPEHWMEVAALLANLALCTAISAKLFRWE
jgi:ABC-2 type transport system permease protein